MKDPVVCLFEWALGFEIHLWVGLSAPVTGFNLYPKELACF